MPTLLPIAWAYSHRISGRSGSVFAYASIFGIRAYIGTYRSVWGFWPAPSYCTVRDGSRSFSAA